MGLLLITAVFGDAPPLLRRVTVQEVLPSQPVRASWPTQRPTFWQNEGRLFYQDGHHGARIRALGPDSFDSLWTWSQPGRFVEFVAAAEKTLFIRTSEGPSEIVALRVETGDSVWSTPIDDYGRGNSTPADRVAIAADDRIMLCGWETLTAFSLDTGAKLFTHRYHLQEGEGVLRTDPSSPSSPKDNRDAKLIWGIDERLFGVDPGTGAILWEFTPKPELRKLGAYDGYVGFGNEIEEPVDGVAIFAFSHKWIGSILVCVDVKSRSVKWSFSCSGIDAFRRDGDAVYVSGSADGTRVWCLDLKTGNLRWRSNASGAAFTPFAVSNNVVYCCGAKFHPETAGGYLYAISKKTGALLWCDHLPAPTSNAPVLLDGRVYVLSPRTEEISDHNGVIQVYADSPQGYTAPTRAR